MVRFGEKGKAASLPFLFHGTPPKHPILLNLKFLTRKPSGQPLYFPYNFFVILLITSKLVVP
jgi:hypothetical protein